jgi:hypothetical protein
MQLRAMSPSSTRISSGPPLPACLVLLFCFSILLSLVEAAGVQIDLSSHFNAKTASTGTNDTLADFDGFHRALPVEHLPSGPTFSYQGINVSQSFS